MARLEAGADVRLHFDTAFEPSLATTRQATANAFVIPAVPDPGESHTQLVAAGVARDENGFRSWRIQPRAGAGRPMRRPHMPHRPIGMVPTLDWCRLIATNKK